MRPNIALKIAPFGRLDAPQAARHLVQRYAIHPAGSKNGN